MYIILADDQFDVRCALKCVLMQEGTIQRIGEAANAAELLAYLRTACPDLVLLDWELPGMNGRELIATMRALCPTVRVIALSVRPEAREEALKAGVQGFASKGEPPERLLAAICKTSYAGVI